MGPVYGHDEPAGELLAACYRTALDEAERQRLASVAFPAISTGAFGYPMAEAASVALETVRRTLPTLSSVRHIRFVLLGQAALKEHERALHELGRSA